MDINTSKENNILNSFKGLQKAVAPNFFYTRLLGKMQNTEEYKKSFSLSLKPALMVAVLAIFFIFNIYSLSQINNNEVDKAIKQQQNISIDTYTYVYSTNNQEIY